jgi:ribosome-binding factor A
MPSNRRYPRVNRINKLLQEVVAEELEMIDDDRLELVTVTGVTAEEDVRRAVVFVSSMPEPVAEALEEHRWRLQAAIGRQASFKRTPQLTFKPDPAIASGSRVEEILRGIDTGDREERG